MKKSKLAEMTIFGALISFAIMLIIFPSYQYMQFDEAISVETNEIQNVLLDVAVADTEIKFDSYKDVYKDDNKNTTNTVQYVDAILTKMGYTDNNDDNIWEKGKFTISTPYLSYNANTRYYNLSFVISAPFSIIGREVADISLNKSISAAIDIKYA